MNEGMPDGSKETDIYDDDYFDEITTEYLSLFFRLREALDGLETLEKTIWSLSQGKPLYNHEHASLRWLILAVKNDVTDADWAAHDVMKKRGVDHEKLTAHYERPRAM